MKLKGVMITSALNTAIDVMASIGFLHVSPLDGNITSGGNPAPNTYPNNYTLPIATVPYLQGSFKIHLELVVHTRLMRKMG